MSKRIPIPCGIGVCGDDIPRYNSRIKLYPDGTQEILACERSIWGLSGWERTAFWPDEHVIPAGDDLSADWGVWDSDDRVAAWEKRQAAKAAANLARAQHRAKAQLRDAALCTKMSYFVTLTLDAAKIDRHDMAAIVHKLNDWLDNRVRRNGLAYILVPERHKDGAIHFHGFFNSALPVEDSGTMVPPGGGKPRKPRTKAQRAEWLAGGGRIVYNLPAWSLGYTTAMELYGEYGQAVGYVCKYIGKDGEKIGGRWYYSGGALGAPEVSYCNLGIAELAALPGAYQFAVEDASMGFVMVRMEGGDNAGKTL